jgi:hypothetical protein
MCIKCDLRCLLCGVFIPYMSAELQCISQAQTLHKFFPTPPHRTSQFRSAPHSRLTATLHCYKASKPQHQ